MPGNVSPSFCWKNLDKRIEYVVVVNKMKCLIFLLSDFHVLLNNKSKYSSIVHEFMYKNLNYINEQDLWFGAIPYSVPNICSKICRTVIYTVTNIGHIHSNVILCRKSEKRTNTSPCMHSNENNSFPLWIICATVKSL